MTTDRDAVGLAQLGRAVAQEGIDLAECREAPAECGVGLCVPRLGDVGHEGVLGEREGRPAGGGTPVDKLARIAIVRAQCLGGIGACKQMKLAKNRIINIGHLSNNRTQMGIVNID